MRRLVVAVLALAAVAVPAEAQVRRGPRLAAAVFARSFVARGVDLTENKPPNENEEPHTSVRGARRPFPPLVARPSV